MTPPGPPFEPATNDVPRVALGGGVTIPQLGYGVCRIDPPETVASVTAALSCGFRHIDTAASYGNERQVGEAIAQSGVAGRRIFVTTKLANAWLDGGGTRSGFERSVGDLGIGYLDLFLIHWPRRDERDIVGVWRAMEGLLAEGRVRAIGVSNFEVDDLELILETATVMPAVNQIELHPYRTREDLRDFHADHGIVTEAWAPLARGEVLGDPVLAAIAEAHGRTVAQVVLRWHLQLGTVVFPKTVTPSRMAENLDVFGFLLEPSEMATISGLERNATVRTGGGGR